MSGVTVTAAGALTGVNTIAAATAAIASSPGSPTTACDAPPTAARHLVAIDLDGTLVTSAGRLCDDAVGELQRLGASALRVIATGRNLASARQLVADGAPIDYIVAGSGGVTYDCRTQQVVRAVAMPAGVADRIATALVAEGHPFFLLHAPPANHRAYAHCPDPSFREQCVSFGRRWKSYEAQPLTVGCDIDGRVVVAETLADGERASDGFGQFLLMGLTLERAQTVAGTVATLDDRVRCVITSAKTEGEYWLEVLPVDVSKRAALETLSMAHDVPVERVVGLGNDYNDVDMLQWVGVPVLVGNAEDGVVDAVGRGPCIRRAETHDQAAVAHALRDLFRDQA